MNIFSISPIFLIFSSFTHFVSIFYSVILFKLLCKRLWIIVMKHAQKCREYYSEFLYTILPDSTVMKIFHICFIFSFLFCFSLWNYFPENPKYHVIFLQHILVPKIKNKLSFLTTMLWLHLIKWTVILHNYFIIIPWLNSPDCLKNICTDYLSKSGLNQGSLITYGRCAF